ncbi:MAG: L-seryl-tRNA(Sec) selenium transferase [Spirochaetes bacterium]|nr:L-seryl-tRNA(Sec) selenium transferase [Spirochaetota bacterium]
MENPFASIPQVSRLLEDERIQRWFPRLSRSLTSGIVASALQQVRQRVKETGVPVSWEEVVETVDRACWRMHRKRIQRVMNGTGVILHTNMGRSPIVSNAWDAVRELNTRYSNLELELQSGKRGLRSGLIPDLLRVLTGAEASIVVNNNAAGILLTLSALAKDREVIVSRGQQIQIGGGFRIPEILSLSGARLVEVGTTNITTLSDYLSAITERTALVLMVHASNFRIRGFTSQPSVKELSSQLPPSIGLVVDQGSGVTWESIPGETPIRSYFEEGAHLVCCSADKVLGGPQAGIVLGKEEWIRPLRTHPLMRAIRPGKTILSLLEEVLIRRVDGPSYTESIYSIPLEELKKFGRRILKGIPREIADLVPSFGTTGGGSAPDEKFRSLAIELKTEEKPESLLSRMRDLPVPLIGIIEGDRVKLNLSTLWGESVGEVRAALFSVLNLPTDERGTRATADEDFSGASTALEEPPEKEG